VPSDVTDALVRWRNGDAEAFQQVMPLVYEEMRNLAARYMRQERGEHTLQSTALVHEAYLRLVDYDRIDWKGRAHFLGIAATVIRNILVDHARRVGRLKRGGDVCMLQLDESIGAPRERQVDLVRLDDALQTLEKLSPEQARIVELRFFAGLSVEETAEAVGISDSTVKRHWTLAKTWLSRELAQNQPG
jgi:RNA polymerase sigma factor (TIGR02999 family)